MMQMQSVKDKIMKFYDEIKEAESKYESKLN